MVNHNPPTRKPTDWIPPVPAFSARIDEPVTIAYYGIQIRGERDSVANASLAEFRDWTRQLTVGDSAPDWRDCAEYVDEHGHFTWVSIFYWRGSPDEYRSWQHRNDYVDFWSAGARVEGETGYFREVLHVPNDRLETLYSDAGLEAGVGGATGEHEGPIQSHNYWGSMRDRIPLSSDDDLEPESLLTGPGDPSRHRGLGERVSLTGRANLATIRSGEDFVDLEGREEEVFHDEIAPAVREGMRFLRDNPVETGCFSCRHMTETDADGNPLKRAFATAHFDSLTRLEDWAESHPTHLRIFGRFIELAQELAGDVKLRLWHEVTVTPSQAQEFEYVNCDPKTGMMPYLTAAETVVA